MTDRTPAPGALARARRDLVESAAEVWDARELLYQFTLRDIRIRYKQAVMGFGWAVLMPTVIVLAGLLVRFAMSRLSGSPMDAGEIAGVAVKSVPWGFFVGALQFGTGSLASNRTLVQKVYFPREVLPISAVCTQAFDSGVGGLALAAALLAFGVPLQTDTVWIVPLLALLALLTASAALLLSCANLFFRDVKYLVQVCLTFGIFFTPVFLEAAEYGRIGSMLVMLNPVAPLLEGIRLAAVEGHDLLQPLHAAAQTGSGVALLWSPWYLGYSTLCALLGSVASVLLFHRLEFLFAEYA